jgi:hypothetical protein
MIQASFGFLLADMENIGMNLELAGGATMDTGSYPVSFVRLVTGTLPISCGRLSRRNFVTATSVVHFFQLERWARFSRQEAKHVELAW